MAGHDAAYIECKGCHKDFTRAGYARHAAMTRNLRCRYIHTSSVTPPVCQTIGSTVDQVTLPHSHAIPNNNSVTISNEETNSSIQPQVDGFTTTYDIVDEDGKYTSYYVI